MCPMKRVLLPFDLPVYAGINSNHPLVACLTLPRYEGIEFFRPQSQQTPPVSAKSVMGLASEFAGRLAQATAGRVELPTSIVLDFVSTRDLTTQRFIDPTADLAFFHTVPVHLDQLPWILHVESITPLFNPSIYPGSVVDLPLRRTAIFWLVRAMLESERCRGIFTNLTSTRDEVHRVFASEVISRKTRYIPAGPYIPAADEARIEAAIARKRERRETVILFTGSWHQNSRSFFLRGGHDLVMAFLAMEAEFPNLRLVLRTSVPDVLANTELTARMRAHPKIRLIETALGEDEILDLFADADIFALDAEAMHSVSILRAMYCGAACIVSDVPGYEDYLDSNCGIILPGRREAMYAQEPESGWMKADFNPMYSPDGRRIERLANLLAELCRNREWREELGRRARRRIQERNSFAGWSAGFEALMREALAKS